MRPPRFLRRWRRSLAGLSEGLFGSAQYQSEDATTARLLYQFIVSRSWGRIASGVGVLAVGAGFAFVVFEGLRISKTDLIASYRRAAVQALEQDQIPTAELWFEKADRLDGGTHPETRYRLALAAERKGDAPRCRQLMQELAPADARGFELAHYWLAHDLLRDNKPLDADATQAALHHLTETVSLLPNERPAREALAQLLLKTGDLEEASKQLQVLTATDQRHALNFARVNVMLGRQDTARRAAQRGIDFYTAQLTRHPRDLEFRVRLAQLEVFLEQFEDATTLLAGELNRRTAESQSDSAAAESTPPAVPRKPDNKSPDPILALRVELAVALVAWYEHVSRTQPGQTLLRLKLLQDAIQVAPDEPLVIDRLAQLVAENSEDSEAAEAVLQQAIAAGKITPLAHLLLGIGAFRRGEREAEEQHLRLALQGDPRLAVAANNLAWLLATREPKKLDEALSLIERAVVVKPTDPDLRCTRGKIYARLGRTEPAILDLEFALAELPDRKDLHRDLADLYAAVGDQALAELHRSQAAGLVD